MILRILGAVRRRIAIVLAVAFGAGAILLAVLPFTGQMSLQQGDTNAGGEGLSAVTAIEGRCRPPVISAWRQSDSEGKGLWAVTVGTNMQGYANMDGRLCADRARRRLVASLALGVAAAGAVIAERPLRPESGPASDQQTPR